MISNITASLCFPTASVTSLPIIWATPNIIRKTSPFYCLEARGTLTTLGKTTTATASSSRTKQLSGMFLGKRSAILVLAKRSLKSPSTSGCWTGWKYTNSWKVLSKGHSVTFCLRKHLTRGQMLNLWSQSSICRQTPGRHLSWACTKVRNVSYADVKFSWTKFQEHLEESLTASTTPRQTGGTLRSLVTLTGLPAIWWSRAFGSKRQPLWSESVSQCCSHV